MFVRFQARTLPPSNLLGFRQHPLRLLVLAHLNRLAFAHPNTLAFAFSHLCPPTRADRPPPEQLSMRAAAELYTTTTGGQAKDRGQNRQRPRGAQLRPEFPVMSLTECESRASLFVEGGVHGGHFSFASARICAAGRLLVMIDSRVKKVKRSRGM